MRGTQKKATRQPLNDAFTLLCRKELGVRCEKEWKFHPVRRWRFDYAFPDFKVALEVEGGVFTGGRHTRSVGFMKDIEKYNTAAMLGWTVVRTVPDELYTGKTLTMLKLLIDARKIRDEKIQDNTGRNI